MHDTATRKRRRRARLPKIDVAQLPPEIVGEFAPAERRALAQIVETADLVETPYGRFFLIPATEDLEDALATFGAELEDREENFPDDEDTHDAEAFSNDLEPSLVPSEGVWGCGLIRPEDERKVLREIVADIDARPRMRDVPRTVRRVEAALTKRRDHREKGVAK